MSIIHPVTIVYRHFLKTLTFEIHVPVPSNMKTGYYFIFRCIVTLVFIELDSKFSLVVVVVVVVVVVSSIMRPTVLYRP